MSAALSELGNNRIAMGANHGPFDIVAGEIELLYAEAKNWADGKGAEAIESDDLEAIKEALDTLDNALLKAGQEVEAIRKDLVKPLDDAKAEIQALAHPLIGDTKAGKGKVVLGRAALNKVRTAINVKIAERKAAAAALAEAEKQAEIEAFKAAREADDGSLESAEQLQQFEASVSMAQKVAKAADKAASIGLGLRTTYRAEVTDFAAAARHYWGPDRDQFEALVLNLAQRDVRAGKHTIPGVTVHKDMKAI